MDPRLLFSIAFPLADPFWALMILLPGWSAPGGSSPRR
jgi:hypothetical protein